MASPLRWQDGALSILDQTRLPGEEVWLRCERPEEVAAAIRRLAVRGAPAIGIAAAYGVALAGRGAPAGDSSRVGAGGGGPVRRRDRARGPPAGVDAAHRREPELGARARH